MPLQSCTMHRSTDIENPLEPEIFPRRKFSLISPPACIGEIYHELLIYPCVAYYTEDMMTFTVLVKIYSIEY